MAVRIFKNKTLISVFSLVVIFVASPIVYYLYNRTNVLLTLPMAAIRVVEPVKDIQLHESTDVIGANMQAQARIADNEVKKLAESMKNKRSTISKRLKQLPAVDKTVKPPLRKPYLEKSYPGDPFHARCYNLPERKQVTHPLTAKEIANSLAKRFEISDRTFRDITEAVDLNLVSINASQVDNIKVILGYHGYEHSPHYTWYNFSHCEYTNCIPLNPHRSLDHPMAPEPITRAASVLLFNLVEMYHGDTLRRIPRRDDQYFAVTSLESTGYSFNLMPHALDGLINMTLTYHRKSTVPEWHIFRACMERKAIRSEPINYAANKSKGAIAYISNCHSMQYNRLDMIGALRSYIPIDLYGGCGTPSPCQVKDDPKCTIDLHKQYHFYLSFENSLCQDYISEKFWDRLSEKSGVVPVAMGGLTVTEYTEQSPENSFIHVRNFTSIEKLGTYLSTLMKDPDAYNSYHKWRESWDVYRRPIYTRFPSCDICRIANEKPYMPADPNLSRKYNDPSRCANYNQFP